MLPARTPPSIRAAPGTHELIQESPGPRPKPGPVSPLQTELAYGAFVKCYQIPHRKYSPISRRQNGSVRLCPTACNAGTGATLNFALISTDGGVQTSLRQADMNATVQRGRLAVFDDGAGLIGHD